MLIAVATLVSCQGRSASVNRRADGDTLSLAGIQPRDSADSVLLAPRVVTGPTVVVFWLPAADTISAPDQASALDDMTYYTDRVAETLTRHQIRLVPTNAETVYVALPNGSRQSILLSGLDYPFGYLLISPGEPERVLAGVYSDEELLDELEAYFDFTADDSASTKPRITT
jgi:hypothetical protein